MTYFEIIFACLIVFIIILSLFKETRGILKEQIKKRPFLSYSLICLTVVAFAFLYFPLFFRYIALEVWDIPVTIYKDGTVEIVALADLGPIGDIFGSLNSFISSIALCAVAFSTWLQVTSLKETRIANQKQLDFSNDVHEAQIKESKYSIFSNMFYALLTQKQASFNNLKLIDKDGNVIVADKIFYNFSTKFLDMLKKDWSNLDLIDEDKVFDDFFAYVRELNNNQTYTDINSYLGYYSSLVELIRRAEIDETDKIFFRDLLTMSISASEQVTLLWISSCTNIYKNRLIGSGIFSLNFNELSLPFAVKFFEKSCFSNSNVLNQWDSYVKKQNPA